MRNLLSTIAAITVLLIGTRITGNAQTVIWDTIGTGTVRLAVSNHGSIGLNGVGGANMDFTSSGLDCDPSADVYIRSGGLFIIQKIDSTAGLFGFSTGLYQNDATASFSFQPDGSGPSSSHFIGPDGSDAFFTGRFLNWDSTIGIEQTYYAPTTGAPNDNFIIVRSDIYPLDGQDHPDLAIGEVIDWDIPSDSDAANIGGIRGRMVYLRGTDTGAVAGCQPNSNRFGSSVFLGMHTSVELNSDSCANTPDFWGNHTIDSLTDTSGDPNGVIDSAALWNRTQALTGQWTLPFNDTTSDQLIYSTFVHGQTLGATDTLTIYTAIISQQIGTVNDLDSISAQATFWYEEQLRCGGLDPNLCYASMDLNGDGNVDFDDQNLLILFFFGFAHPVDTPSFDLNLDCVIDFKDFDVWQFCAFFNPPGDCNYPRETCCDPVLQLIPPCCQGVTGNIDNDPDDKVDISDLTALIDHQFINFAPLGCREEGNIDGDPNGTVDIADLTHLIDHLFINFPPTADCQ